MTHENPLSFDTHPEITQAVEGAFNASQHAHIPGQPTNPLDDVTASARAQNALHTEFSSADLNLDFRTSVEQAWVNARESLQIEQGSMPHLTHPVFKGINWERLQTAHAVMNDAKWNPEIVISPTTFSRKDWAKVFSSLPRTIGGGLPPESLTMDVASSLMKPIGEPNWSIDVIPGSTIPPISGFVYNTSNKSILSKIRQGFDSETETGEKIESLYEGNMTPSRNHPSLSMYLTLQALRLHANKRPIDSIAAYSTWLRGTRVVGNVQFVHTAKWNVQIGQIVLLKTLKLRTTSPEIGTRLIVRGNDHE